MERRFAEAWNELVQGQRRGVGAVLARLGLRLASIPYGNAARLRNACYDCGLKRITRVGVPVLSVGNLSLGGTGKTPCVEYVGRWFRERDIRVTILSRGYGRLGGQNDEAMLLEENLPDVPHLQGADRVSLALLAVEELESEVLILDDGFQHRRLDRDLDIVLIDATRPPMRDLLFPRGTLREPASGLKRAGALVMTRCDQASPAGVKSLKEWLSRRFPRRPIAATEHRPIDLLGGEKPEPLERLRDRAVLAFCGIGNPQSFRGTLLGLGVRLSEFREYPDHHAYSREDVEKLSRLAEHLPKDGVVITTQKDWVKLRVPELAGRHLRAVRIGLSFQEGQDEFDAMLRACVPATAEDDDGIGMSEPGSFS